MVKNYLAFSFHFVQAKFKLILQFSQLLMIRVRGHGFKVYHSCTNTKYQSQYKKVGRPGQIFQAIIQEDISKEANQLVRLNTTCSIKNFKLLNLPWYQQMLTQLCKVYTT